jgi:chorismate--pyruvate lyase
MDHDYKTLSKHPVWCPDNPLSVAKLDQRLRTLVCHKTSLTAALVAINSSFCVNIVRQQVFVPCFHEQQALGRPISRAALVREVELQFRGEAVVFARSIIPLSLLNKGGNSLANLGRTPLGHLLFKDGKIRVSKREFAKLDFAQGPVTARRTPYDYQGSQILVSEFFLPAIFQYI